MVTDHEPWSERAANWTAHAVAAGVPLLGICYGHQLLAYALGGEVGPNPAGREFGTVEVRFEQSAAGDPLFAGIAGRVAAHTSHAQSVLRLPPGAVCLATSAKDRCQAFSIGQAAWGVQFHPEFDAHIAGTYVRRCAEILHREGIDTDALLHEIRDTPQSSAILARFGRIACGVPT
jgi:GMP synthase (glutamine-hydrolysing)